MLVSSQLETMKEGLLSRQRKLCLGFQANAYLAKKGVQKELACNLEEVLSTSLKPEASEGTPSTFIAMHFAPISIGSGHK